MKVSTKYIKIRPSHANTVVLVLSVFLIISFPNHVKAEADFEAKLKTAYLVNIAQFTSWPGNDVNIVLCIFSQSALIDEVKELSDMENVNSMNLSVVVDPSNLDSCHMLYLDKNTYNNQHNNILTKAHKSLLTISDLDDSLDSNVAIQFFVRNLKLRFSINQEVIKKSNYKISSKLQRLAKQIE